MAAPIEWILRRQMKAIIDASVGMLCLFSSDVLQGLRKLSCLEQLRSARDQVGRGDQPVDGHRQRRQSDQIEVRRATQ